MDIILYLQSTSKLYLSTLLEYIYPLLPTSYFTHVYQDSTHIVAGLQMEGKGIEHIEAFETQCSIDRDSETVDKVQHLEIRQIPDEAT